MPAMTKRTNHDSSGAKEGPGNEADRRGAKKDETRLRRVAKMKEMLAAGKNFS